MHASNNRANYVKQKLVELPRKIKESSIILEELFTPFSEVYRFSWQKINEVIVELNNTINQLYITDIYRLCPTGAEYICLLSSHRTFFKPDHILTCIIHINQFKRTEIINVFSQTTMRLN